MKILKFGGSSLGSPEAIRKVVNILRSRIDGGERMAVVVSAFRGTTDELIECANIAASGSAAYKKQFQLILKRHRQIVKEFIVESKTAKVFNALDEIFDDLRDLLHGVALVGEASARTLDVIMSFGERGSALLLSEILNEFGVVSEFLDSRGLIRTDSEFGSAQVDFSSSYELIREYFKEHSALQIVTGFVAATERGETTTLGRGGSDYTASLLGAALKVSEIEIWTDVDGVMTADPRKVERAFSIEHMTYQEAMELSHFGAKVIYPPTIQPALASGIPLRIRNTFNSEFAGTLIVAKGLPTARAVKGISPMDNVSLLLVQGSGMIGVAGASHRLFGALAREKISVILITQASSEHSICIAVTPEVASRAKKVLEEEFALEIHAGQLDKINVGTDLSIIATVGENMHNSPGIAGRLFQALGKNGINIIAIAQGSSELNISVVIPRKDQKKALNVLHETFFLSDIKTLNVFMVGPGQVGAALLRQLSEHATVLREENQLDVKLVGLANSKKMVFDVEEGLLPDWREGLGASSEIMCIDRFVKRMNSANLRNSVLVDCTAGDDVPAAYSKVLEESISIVTPNKKANSGPFELYQQLKEVASKANVKFYYETNVGAGLPVISTLRDLLFSGDEVLKIEAVLSGTLSFLFGAFTSGRSFSDVVREAKQKGYTEPDPRDDLSGMDVARKVLILAREVGVPLELKDVEVENLVPECCRNASSVEDFFTQLANVDSVFDERLESAEQRGEKLCYIASLEGQKAIVGLRSVAKEHPFYSLSAGDNIISFHTKRYLERPLVVNGPGAGTEVTAAGVLADIIRVAN